MLQQETEVRPPLIQVEFFENEDLQHVVLKIQELKKPHIILWYIGSYGLKKAGAEFYRNSIIDPIISKNKQSKFILVDLTAWGSLRDSNLTINDFSSHVKTINHFGIQQIQCIKSSMSFQRIKSIRDKTLLNYFRKALRRPFVRQSSLKAKLAGFTTGSLFSKDCPIMEEWFDLDASRSYSPLQYLEAFVIIEEILTNSSEASIDIVFALPNDELKYYKDKENSFKNDLEFFLKHQKHLTVHAKNIRVSFCSFAYGELESHRPYHAPSEVIRKNKLFQETLVSSRSSSNDG